MGDVINLKQFRKRAEREQSAKRSDANRARLAEPSPNALGMNGGSSVRMTCWSSIG